MEWLWQVPELISTTIKRSYLCNNWADFCGGFHFHNTNINVVGIDWVHSRGSGINHSSETTKRYWCPYFPGGHIIVATGKLATRTAPCRVFPHGRTILLSLFRASNISEAALVSESRYVRASD